MKKLNFKNFLATFISSFFFLNIYGLYLKTGLIILLFLLFYLNDTLKFIDSNFILLLFFGFTFCFFDKLYFNYYFRNILSFIFISPFVYLLGRHLGSIKRSEKGYLLFYTLTATCLTFVYSYSIVKEVFTNGINAQRIYFIEFASRQMKSIQISVTGICAHFGPSLSFLSLLFLRRKPSLNHLYKFIFIMLIVLALFVSIVTATRNPQVIALIVIIISVLKGNKSRNLSRIIFVLASIGFFIYTVTLYVSQLDFFSSIVSRYLDEDINTVGDRSVAWKLGFINLFEFPFGGEPMNTVSYYHNFWLDIRKVSGILPFFIMLVFTIENIRFLFFKRSLNVYQRPILEFSRIGFITILLTMFVEPIIEGSPVVFYFFIFYCGFNKSFYSIQFLPSKA